MKPRKKRQDINSAIAGGNNEENKQKKTGRPKNKLPTKQQPFYLSLGVIQAINDNCGGNKSFWAEQLFREWFKSQGIEVDDSIEKK